MSDKISTFFISVGEPSGDIHAAKLVLSLKKISPKIKFIGNGGDKMIEAGVDVKNHIDTMSVMGFVEVLKNYNIYSFDFKTKKKFKVIAACNEDLLNEVLQFLN